MGRVAKALIFDADANALILRRSSTHPYWPHEADLPGGAIEKGETKREGLVREIKEEIGLDVEPDSLQLAETTSRLGLKVRELFTLQLDSVKPPVDISWEHESYEWIEPGRLRTSIESTDPFMKVLENYLDTKI